MDPYRKARYDQGVDAKIVIMGNTGKSLASSPAARTKHSLPCLAPSMQTDTSCRRRQDQPPPQIYPGQVRSQEYHLHHRRVLRDQEGKYRRHKGQAAVVGYGGPGAISQYGSSPCVQPPLMWLNACWLGTHVLPRRERCSLVV